jgi:hypothetical protein
VADVWYAIERGRSFHKAENAYIVFLFELRQFLLCLALLPELARFFFKFKRAIICREGSLRISFEFRGHLASHCTRKYINIA